MLVLFDTPAGFALFKLKNGKMTAEEAAGAAFASPEAAAEAVKLKGFSKFKDTTEALASATAIAEGKTGKALKKFLQKNVVDKELKDKLAVSDTKLGNHIKEKLGIKCVSDSTTQEIMRGIRAQIETLITGIDAHDMTAMALGLAHSLSRYKLKFSPDKVDTMIVQAISLLDDIDKELNTYSMRVREWYGWHFPEMGKIVTDNLAYARLVDKMGVRTNAVSTDMEGILEEEMADEVKEAAEISMGTEISDEDMTNIRYLCGQVVSITEYRAQLFEYLKNRMTIIAPNLTTMVGELVGARLVAHAGSLLSLAKHPASTVQILGAEKALFRALKTKHDTPKYGLLYHASLVGQSAPKNKGKISRVLAAKCSLAARIDALADDPTAEPALEYRAKVESRVRQLEGGAVHSASTSQIPPTNIPKLSAPQPSKSYNTDADVKMDADDDTPKKKSKKDKKDKKSKKDKKDKKRKLDDGDDETAEEEPKKKKKKKKSEE